MPAHNSSAQPVPSSGNPSGRCCNPARYYGASCPRVSVVRQYVQIEDNPLLWRHDLPPLDLFSTPLLAGGELLPIPGANDTRRHHIARMAQVDELIGFLERAHDPSHILVVVGDFNVIGGTADYEDLAAHMDRAQLKDIWPNNGIGPGPTCTFTEPSQIPPDPDEPDMVMDTEHDEAGERLDYIWLRSPDNLIVTPERPRRWAFSDRGVQGGPAGSLSDHLAISTTLQIQARDAQP